MEIFGRAGYQNASFAAVAEAVGLTLPGLLHHFPRKVDLLIAVLEQRDTDMRTRFPVIDDSWLGTLDSLIQVARYNETVPGVVRAFSLLSVESLTEDHPAAAWFAARTEETRGLMARAFRRGLAEGTLKPDRDPEALAAEVMAVMDGLQIQWLRAGTAFDLSGIFEAYARHFIETHRA
ncbi:TetR family transcriptional regulator [Pseudooceanicola sp. GBMRC 2024]|uniref:TetR family transcriptional regulator n=2 Tax=Paracoccaceae TaxID=31989 RepID=A0A6L7G0H0_9RHOB|nr:TetR family transcriptional regulator [Pseudooceanicola albus]